MRKLQILGRLALLIVLAAVAPCGLRLAAPTAQAGSPENAKSTAGDASAGQGVLATKHAETDPKLIALRDRLRGVLRYYSKKKLNTAENTAWEVMHMVIAQGVEAELHVGGPNGEIQNSIGWLCYNHVFKGDRILTVENGRPLGVIDVGLQGHHGQLLAILAQSRLRRDYPMRVDGRAFTVEDLIENEKLTCRSGMELTFKLIALSHYLPTDAVWTNEIGQEWSISRLIREEIRAPIQGAACGGTHRLMGLSYAVRKREKEGKPIDGDFARAQKYVQEYHHYTFHLQNPDGSFSTQWLEYREARPDFDRRLQTTGHILEWLAFSLSEQDLRDPDAVRAVEYLTNLLGSHRNRDWPIGPLGHGLHALALYDQRAFGPGRSPAPDEVSTSERPPSREPRGTARAVDQEWTGERSVLIRQWALRHAQRSVLAIPTPPPEIEAWQDGSTSPAGESPRLGSDSGPLLVPPRPVLK